jgi:hypothetical protein
MIEQPMIAVDHVPLAAPPGCGAAARCFFGELLGLREIHKPAFTRGTGGVWFLLERRKQAAPLDKPRLHRYLPMIHSYCREEPPCRRARSLTTSPS